MWEKKEISKLFETKMETHPEETSLVPRPSTVHQETWARCRWCPGLWPQTQTWAPPAGWWAGPRPEPAGCSRPAPPGPAAWWHGCRPCSRRWWRWRWRPRPTARTSPSRRLCPRLSVAVRRWEETSKSSRWYKEINNRTERGGKKDVNISEARFKAFCLKDYSTINYWIKITQVRLMLHVIYIQR